jgi:hypothetical protein
VTVESLREVVRFEQETGARIEARLALTDAERAAIADAIDVFAESAIHIDNAADRRRAETLRRLLRRLS